MKHIPIINLVSWLLIMLSMLGSCSNDETFPAEGNDGSTVILQLLEEYDNVEINTRALSDENTIEDVFVLTYRNGKPKFQSFPAQTMTAGKITLSITDFQVKEGDKLYVCCNTGTTSVPTETTADAFFERLTYTNNETKMIMYGSTIVSSGSISIALERVFAKTTMTWPVGYTITSWKVCNAPSAGYVSKDKSGYPTGTSFNETITPPVSGTTYFVPRTDNSTTSDPKTYLLVNVEGKGWYKLDFYNGSTWLDIQRNTHYQFIVSSVSTDGYSTEEEAVNNDGSNVTYNIEVSTGKGVSNGQYSLLFDRNEIALYPVGKDKDAADEHATLEALNVSAMIPNLQSAVSTYIARLVSPSGQIYLLDEAGNRVNPLDLNPSNELITTANSRRTLRLQFSGADTYGSYIEVQLGNIKKRIPIYIISANCYLADFASNTGNTLYIPVLQANRDGVERINPSDNLTTDIVWSDQANVTTTTLSITYDKAKQWLEVTNNVTFSGNVVIAILKDGEIKWSWHIWSLDNTVLEWDTKNLLYDFRAEHTNTYGGFTFMDRNVGAYTLEKDGRSSDWGVVYQFGRKDPFPAPAGNANISKEPTVYHNGNDYTMESGHPQWGDCMVELSTTGTNLEYSIEHPYQWIYGKSYIPPNTSFPEQDWYSDLPSNRNDFLWIDKKRNNTAYNPCPAGWTIAYTGNGGPWVGLHPNSATEKNNNGITFTEAGYFPYAPMRNVNGKPYYSEGTYIYWGIHGGGSFLATYLGPDKIEPYAYLRAAGFYIRCVRKK